MRKKIWKQNIFWHSEQFFKNNISTPALRQANVDQVASSPRSAGLEFNITMLTSSPHGFRHVPASSRYHFVGPTATAPSPCLVDLLAPPPGLLCHVGWPGGSDIIASRILAWHHCVVTSSGQPPSSTTPTYSVTSTGSGALASSHRPAPGAPPRHIDLLHRFWPAPTSARRHFIEPASPYGTDLGWDLVPPRSRTRH